MKKWLLIIIIALVVLNLNSHKQALKKQSDFLFRCSADKTGIEFYNKVTGGFDVWQNCGDLGCMDTAIGPTCGEVKAGSYGFRCSADAKSIELFNRESMKFLTYQVCNGECVMDGELPVCEGGSVEVVQETKSHLYLVVAIFAVLAVAAILFYKKKGGI